MKKRRRDASLQSTIITQVLPQLSWEDIQGVMLEACVWNMAFLVEYLKGQLKTRTEDPVVLCWIDELKEVFAENGCVSLHYGSDANRIVRLTEKMHKHAEGNFITLTPSWYLMDEKPAAGVITFLQLYYYEIKALCLMCTSAYEMRCAWNGRSIRVLAPLQSPFDDGTFPNSPWLPDPSPPPPSEDEKEDAKN